MKQLNPLVRRIDIHFVDMVKALAKDTGVCDEDVDYVIRRFNSEGVVFLTSTLPKLAKSVCLSIEVGYFIRPTDFSWKGRLLRFMHSLLSKIFDPRTGTVLDDADGFALANLRQFCEYFYKLAFDSSDDVRNASCEKFESNEILVKDFVACDEWVELLRSNLETHYPTFCRTHASDVFASYRPRYGPGSFSKAYAPVDNPTVYKALPHNTIGTTTHAFAPFSGYFKSYPSSCEPIRLIDEHKISEVTFVAKDSRGPRVISMEPLHLLRAQLSFLDWAIDALQDDSRGRIQFVDQSRNSEYAKIASVDRRRATLDLKDASDRVSYSLVRRIFRNTYAPAFFLRNARSTHALLPTGNIVTLSKVAGMGSGLTFPIMSLLIHLSICSLVSERFGKPYDSVMRSVYVYGDDVIIPTCWYDVAVTALQRSGLLVNKEKSFYRGFFRESCGGDFFKGVNVTPCKLRLDKVDLRQSSYYRRFLRLDNDRQIYKLSAHTRQLAEHGLITLKALYDISLRRSLGRSRYPKVTGSSPIVGEYVYGLTIRDSVPVWGFTLEPVRRKNTSLCPYKFLSRTLHRRVFETYDLIKDIITNAGLSFGEYIRPRDMKLKLRRHPGTKTY